MNAETVSAELVFHARRHLVEDFLPKIRACLEKLSEEEIWWRPNPESNSVGNLLLHLSGNVRQWIIASLGGLPDRRQRSREFSEQGPIAKEQLLQNLEETVEEALQVLSRLDATALLETRKIQASENVSGLQAVLHVVEHFSYHTGQIVYVTKMLKSEDLGFYNL